MSTPKNEAWDAFLSTIPTDVRDGLQKIGQPTLPVEGIHEDLDDEDEAYDRFIATLPTDVRASMMRKPVQQPEATVETAVARYGIVEAPDGEWAQMRLFKTADGLVRRIAQLEGTDTVVWCFFGLPLPITKGPQRYLSMPGGAQMLQIPLFDGGPSKLVDADLLQSVAIEESGYIGPPELAEAVIQPEDEEAQAAVSGDDDD